jgi:hypothetical protein
MAVQSVHPSAFELAFRLYDRAIHPELFDIQASAKLEGAGWTAGVAICTGGHVIAVRTAAGVATELAIPAMLTTPDRGLAAGHKLGASRDWSVTLSGGVQAHFSAHVDAVDAIAYRNIEQELTLDARKSAVSFRFPGAGRLEPSPLSVIRAEAVANGVMFHAFHTFPGDLAILRTQSLYELPAES